MQPAEVLVCGPVRRARDARALRRLRAAHRPLDGRRPRPGIARAMNIGLRAAHHELVLITNDDITVAPDWVARAHALLRRGPGIARHRPRAGRRRRRQPGAVDDAVRARADVLEAAAVGPLPRQRRRRADAAARAGRVRRARRVRRRRRGQRPRLAVAADGAHDPLPAGADGVAPRLAHGRPDRRALPRVRARAGCAVREAPAARRPARRAVAGARRRARAACPGRPVHEGPGAAHRLAPGAVPGRAGRVRPRRDAAVPDAAAKPERHR